MVRRSRNTSFLNNEGAKKRPATRRSLSDNDSQSSSGMDSAPEDDETMNLLPGSRDRKNQIPDEAVSPGLEYSTYSSLDLQLPTMWNVQERNEETELGWPTGLVLSLDFREVTLPSYAYSPQTVLANHPLDLTARENEVYYFEAQVSSGLGSFIIGFAPGISSYKRGVLGRNSESWGYEVASGEIYHDGKPYLQPLRTRSHSSNDVIIGAGVNFSRRLLFFTRDGSFETAIYPADFDSFLKGMYPAVSLELPGESVRANFGPLSFIYDRENHASDVSSSSTKDPSMQIPPEILAQILECVSPNLGVVKTYYRSNRMKAYKRALGSCALTCRYWASKCRPLIFEYTTLRSGEDLDGLLDLIATQESLISRSIRVLHIYDTADLNASGPWAHRALATLPHRLTNLECVKLSHAKDSAKHLTMLPPRISRALPALFSAFDHIQELTFVDQHFDSMADLMRVIGAVRSLKKLDCEGLSWRTPMDSLPTSVYSSGQLSVVRAVRCQELWPFIWLLMLPSRLSSGSSRTSALPSVHAQDTKTIGSIVQTVIGDASECIFKHVFAEEDRSWCLSTTIPLRSDIPQLTFRLMVRKLSSTQNPPRRKTHAGLQTYLANVDLAIPHVKEIQPILDYDWYAIDRTLSRSAFIGGCKLSFKQMKSKRRDPRKDILDGLSVRMPYAHSTGILQIEFPGCDDKTNDRNEVFVGRFPWAKTGRTVTDDLDVLLAALVPDYPSRRAYIADVIRDSDEWFARIILRNRTSVIEFLRHWKASSLTAGISITTGDTAPSQISASEESMSLEDLTDKDSNKAPTTIVCWLLDYTAGGIEIGADTDECPVRVRPPDWVIDEEVCEEEIIWAFTRIWPDDFTLFSDDTSILGFTDPGSLSEHATRTIVFRDYTFAASFMRRWNDALAHIAGRPSLDDWSTENWDVFADYLVGPKSTDGRCVSAIMRWMLWWAEE